MTHQLTLALGDATDLEWAQTMVERNHYLRHRVDHRARPMAYIIRHAGTPVGLVMLGIPHATRCQGWWGYPGLITQWQVVDLCRIWISPFYQPGEYGIYTRERGVVPGFVDRRGTFRPTTATWAIGEVLQRVQADRVRLWPPVYPDQPYHIELAISYSDPKFHKGTIYREAHAQPMYTQTAHDPVPGPSGKFGWAWRLGRPAWEWGELSDIKPRTMRLI